MAQDSIPRDALVGNLQSRYTWRKVERPKPWRPKLIGEVLLGFYGGKSVRTGTFGEYTVVIVHVPSLGSFTLSGVQVIQKFDVADLKIGWPVRVVWQGYEDLGEVVEETEMAGVKIEEDQEEADEAVRRLRGRGRPGLGRRASEGDGRQKRRRRDRNSDQGRQEGSPLPLRRLRSPHHRHAGRRRLQARLLYPLRSLHHEAGGLGCQDSES